MTPTEEKNMHAIWPLRQQLFQPTPAGGKPDVAPKGAPQTQYGVHADAPECIQEAAAALGAHHYERAEEKGITPIPPAGVEVGNEWVPSAILLSDEEKNETS